jgi:hypothetical protein
VFLVPLYATGGVGRDRQCDAFWCRQVMIRLSNNHCRLSRTLDRRDCAIGFQDVWASSQVNQSARHSWMIAKHVVLYSPGSS